MISYGCDEKIRKLHQVYSNKLPKMLILLIVVRRCYSKSISLFSKTVNLHVLRKLGGQIPYTDLTAKSNSRMKSIYIDSKVCLQYLMANYVEFFCFVFMFRKAGMCEG